MKTVFDPIINIKSQAPKTSAIKIQSLYRMKIAKGIVTKKIKEKNTALKLQSFARGYLSRKQREATKWVNNQLNNQKINPEDLLFKIAKKDINVPTNLSLHLVLDSLIEKGADVHAKDNNGWTPLHWASYRGNLKMAQLLIEKGADVHAKENKGWTPLHCASSKGHLEIAQLLLEKGADMHAKENKGWTPLHLAAVNGYIEIVQVLLEKEADVNATDAYRLKPLFRALKKGYLEIVQLLIEKVADLDTKIITFFKDNDSFKDTIIKRINKLNPQKLNSNQILANRELNIVNGQNKKKYFI